MSEKEKPLHVRVAEALGHATAEHHVGDTVHWTLYIGGDTPSVPHYDTDWAATGPLIEKFRIILRPIIDDPSWAAGVWEEVVPSSSAIPRVKWTDLQPAGDLGHPTALEAVCNLILVLKEAGKLAV